ncbi:hypothetical protein C1S86_10615 [Vibrio parahaemolyticus]|uniref:ABC-three component system protein n=2 Tax=Vibrionaceae TaxID=641 RepID=UPI000C876255|nr:MULTISPECIES: ABC-three component system protein [Vibrio]EJG1643658.1 hypothetical protein [Vibrio parahaemolyticus]ELA6985234.1 hypothetical protein [Vibrio parahaemolyticus]ELA9712067.1 hypothetical protein [Vibrio parahaemolyticus]ELA9726089.1 hypothetical protein [Vibrio parahaemolyticus]MBE4054061.1 hypothetical protein [Vibrio parahaemolyticus]
MDERSPIDIYQSQGIGSSGEQVVKIDQSVHNHYPKVYKHLVETHIGSITFNPNQLRKVVEVIAENYDELEQYPRDFDTIPIEKKNILNNLSQAFYDNVIARDYEPYFTELDLFLKLRTSEDLQKKVGSISRNLNKNILSATDSIDKFETLLSSIENSLLDSQFEELDGKEDAITLFLYYLYANCFIGRKIDEEKLC